MTTEVANVFSELGSGNFQSQLSTGINELIEKVREHGSFGKEGNLEIKLKFVPAKDGDQLVVSSALAVKIPTDTGHRTEVFNHSTPFFIDGDGNMVAYVPEEGPDGQANLEV